LRIFLSWKCTTRADNPLHYLQLALLSGQQLDLCIKFLGAVKIEHSRSRFMSDATPMPPEVEKGFGQSQFRSLPETSFTEVSAAPTAGSGSAEPIW